MDQPPPTSLSKSWSCAVDSNNISNKNNFHHRPSALSAVSSRLPSFDGFQLSPIEDFNFDPNDRQYLFCCGKGHSTVGVKVIAGYVFNSEFILYFRHLLDSKNILKLGKGSNTR
ncbi:unnamed protein product [Meloidogyne enterolobii]|uniref:Uncharacterized protein n=1 Tax=Meloidogyne enterolobii TaxID=390850 RepID=A0ACB1AGL2_MELEN